MVDRNGQSNSSFVAESLHDTLKTQLETSRKINLKHLNQEGLPKKCNYQKPCRICVVGEDELTSEKSNAIYRRTKEATDDYIYRHFLYSFLKEKAAHRTEVALGSLGVKSSGAKEGERPKDKQEE